MKVLFHDKKDNKELKYVVIITRDSGGFIFVKHHSRDTWEIPGGHIESGETPLDAASRELAEETGALDFKLHEVCTYEVNRDGTPSYGVLFYAYILNRRKKLEFEIDEIKSQEQLPKDLTYPGIQPFLFYEVLRRINWTICRKFSDSGDIFPLEGGQEESYRVGDVVIKPVPHKDEYLWFAELFENNELLSRFYTRPVKSFDGNFIEHGYCATRFIPGDFHKDKMSLKIEISREFNSLLKNIPKPTSMDLWVSPWTKAQDVVWKRVEMPNNLPDYCNQLLEKISEIDLKNQIIHCDLAGNILFSGENPFIIDFSPGYYPAEYALAILIVDSIVWFNADINWLKEIHTDLQTSYQLVIRAILFRVLVPYFFDPTGDIDGEYKAYKGLLDKIDSLFHVN